MVCNEGLCVCNEGLCVCNEGARIRRGQGYTRNLVEAMRVLLDVGRTNVA